MLEEIGGFLSLMIGASFISFLELIAFAILATLNKCCKLGKSTFMNIVANNHHCVKYAITWIFVDLCFSDKFYPYKGKHRSEQHELLHHCTHIKKNKIKKEKIMISSYTNGFFNFGNMKKKRTHTKYLCFALV